MDKYFMQCINILYSELLLNEKKIYQSRELHSSSQSFGKYLQVTLTICLFLLSTDRQPRLKYTISNYNH
jgi:hypothetical protein